MVDLAAYHTFIGRKVPVAQCSGFEVGLDEIHPYLSDHARAMVIDAGGRVRAEAAVDPTHRQVNEVLWRQQPVTTRSPVPVGVDLPPRPWVLGLALGHPADRRSRCCCRLAACGRRVGTQAVRRPCASRPCTAPSSRGDHEHHVACGAALEAVGRLRPEFMVLPPVSFHPEVWSDVMRARTLNAAQALAGRVKHLCPLQLDVTERVIRQRSAPGERVYDPFGGLGTVPYLAVKLRRFGEACELNPAYWADSVRHVEAAAAAAALPTLFDLLDLRPGDPLAAPEEPAWAGGAPP